MERLTERDDDGTLCIGINHIGNALERLADYEDAEEQGRLIEFPVAIGQHLWRVEAYPPSITETTVISLHTDGNGNLFAHAQEDGKGNIHTYILSGLGDWLFTDREQAEAKLKERESKVEECIKTYKNISKEDQCLG